VIALVVIEARQRRTDQLAIGKIILIVCRSGWDRVHCFFHSGATPGHAFARNRTLKRPLRMCLRRLEISPTVPQEWSNDNAALGRVSRHSPGSVLNLASQACPAGAGWFERSQAEPCSRIVERSMNFFSRPLPLTRATRVATIKTVQASTGAKMPP